MNLAQMNAFDSVAAHGRAISSAGWAFDAASDEAVADLMLDTYRIVVWAAGEETTADGLFSRAQQDQVRTFVEGGGALWVSGAEVLWDLDAQGSTDDQAFADEILGALMDSDDAGTDRVDGEDILAGIPMDFGLDVGSAYPVEFPDSLTSPGTVIARYSTDGVAGTLTGTVAIFGFPFEIIADASSRDAVAAAELLVALAPACVPPDATATPSTGTETGTGTGTGTGSETGTGTGPGPGVDDPRTVEGPSKRGCGRRAAESVSYAPQSRSWLSALAARRR